MKLHARLLLPAMVLLMLISGCSGELSRGEAEDLISEYCNNELYNHINVGHDSYDRKDIKQYNIYKIPFQVRLNQTSNNRIGLSDFTLDRLLKYIDEGYIKNGIIEVDLPKQYHKEAHSCWASYNVKITDKTKPYLVEIYREHGLYGYTYIGAKILGAKLDDVEVSGIVGDDKKAVVEANITYKISPVFYQMFEDKEYQMKYEFVKYDDGWRINKGKREPLMVRWE